MAAYKKGDIVRVICVADETSNDKYLQEIGTIENVITKDTGATEENPLYDIKFFGEGGNEQYWEEELIREKEV